MKAGWSDASLALQDLAICNFFSICNQIINFHAGFWGRFLRWRRVNFEQIINYDWPYMEVSRNNSTHPWCSWTFLENTFGQMPLRPAQVMNPYLNDWFLCCRQTSFHVSNLSWSDTIFTFLGFQINLTVFSSPPHWFFKINYLKCFWINLEPLSKWEPRSPDIHYYIIIGLIYLSLKDCYNVGFQNSVEPERGLNRKNSTLKLTL